MNPAQDTGNGRWISRSRATILITDDDPAIRTLIEHVLQADGYAVILAENGEEALRLAATEKVDLVLLDLTMPVKGGWETVECLTNKKPLLPVVIITARPDQFFTALSSGVGALLEKPLDCQRLLDVIERLLNESKYERLARMAGQPASFEYVHGTTN